MASKLCLKKGTNQVGNQDPKDGVKDDNREITGKKAVAVDGINSLADRNIVKY